MASRFRSHKKADQYSGHRHSGWLRGRPTQVGGQMSTCDRGRTHRICDLLRYRPHRNNALGTLLRARNLLEGGAWTSVPGFSQTPSLILLGFFVRDRPGKLSDRPAVIGLRPYRNRLSGSPGIPCSFAENSLLHQKNSLRRKAGNSLISL